MFDVTDYYFFDNECTNSAEVDMMLNNLIKKLKGLRALLDPIKRHPD